MISRWMARKIIFVSLASTFENFCASEYNATGKVIPAVLEAGIMLLLVTILRCHDSGSLCFMRAIPRSCAEFARLVCVAMPRLGKRAPSSGRSEARTMAAAFAAEMRSSACTT